MRKELEKTKKEKDKLKKVKSTTGNLKALGSSFEAETIPKEKYCKLEADYDQALQKIGVSCLHVHTQILCIIVHQTSTSFSGFPGSRDQNRA